MTVSAPGRQPLQVSESEELRAFGFSPDGAAFVIATSPGLAIYRREDQRWRPVGARAVSREIRAAPNANAPAGVSRATVSSHLRKLRAAPRKPHGVRARCGLHAH